MNSSTYIDEPSLSAMFDPSAAKRMDAVRNSPRTSASAFALRAVVLFDRTVVVRVAAAEALGRFEDPVVGAMLRDALRDPSPLVRDAAARSIARCGAVEVCSALSELALTDENWTVRRTCVFAYAALAGFDAVPTLMSVLEEPFWRVRHAAVMMLESLGRASEGVRDRVIAESLTTPAAKRAVIFLESRWALQAPSLHVKGDHLGDDNDPWYDDDPAVMTAKVLAKTPPPERLIAMLGESHEPLRRLAIDALSRSEDRVALAGVACWLDVPRVPHAASSARKVLRVSANAALDVAIAAIDTKLSGVAAWAIQLCAVNGRTELAQKILARATDADCRVRAAVAFAIPLLDASAPDAEDVALLLLRDVDSSVREAVVGALVQLSAPRVEAALRAMSLRDLTSAAKIELIQWAAFTQDFSVLHAAAGESHPFVAGTALSALRAAGVLTEAERLSALASHDPWIRGAVVSAVEARELLANEPDPIVRRILIDRVCAEKSEADPVWLAQVAALARRDGDPWIRARGVRLSDPRDLVILTDLVHASTDPSMMVRSAVVEALDGDHSVGARVESLLREDKIAEHAQSVALSWVIRSAEDPVPVLKTLADVHSLREKVATVALTLTDVQRERLNVDLSPRAAVEMKSQPVRLPYPTQSHRAFGRTGLALSPLAFSGVSEAPEGAFVEARERGVNTFFWEPRHRNLTRFIRNSPKKHALHVIGGSYHADAESIRADVDRALRLLRVERLGVFLLFWARSPARLTDETFAVLEGLKRDGKIAAHGFSTHLRSLAISALVQNPWDVVMTRYNAAHCNAENQLLPAIKQSGAAGVAFTALCYGRLLRKVGAGFVGATDPTRSPSLPTASECYRFAISHDAVNLVLTAPSSMREAREALSALNAGPLETTRMREVRAHGAAVYAEDTEFNALIRKGDRIQLGSPRDVALGLMDAHRVEI